MADGLDLVTQMGLGGPRVAALGEGGGSLALIQLCRERRLGPPTT